MGTEQKKSPKSPYLPHRLLHFFLPMIFCLQTSLYLLFPLIAYFVLGPDTVLDI